MSLESSPEPTLPADWYYDPRQFVRESAAVWHREWVCVGRVEDLPRAGDRLAADVAGRQVVVHRQDRSSFPAEAGRPVHVDAWGGFLFVSLADSPESPLRSFLGSEADALDRWPLDRLRSVHRETKSLACNWKVFWENYSECYHCPGLHPELCRIVPLYRKGVLSHADLRGWEPRDAADDGRPTVGPGLSTWTLDGRSVLPLIEGPDERDRATGMVFASFTASMFIVAHPDYVRSVRLLPRGPEAVELTIDWLAYPDVAERYPEALERTLALGRLVVEQDGVVCELNQRGLRSRRHVHGVLMPQEHELRNFHEWLRQKLAVT